MVIWFLTLVEKEFIFMTNLITIIFQRYNQY